MKMARALALTCALLTTACSSPQPVQQSELNLAGYPPAFRDGYIDGCNIARRATNAGRDEARFKADSMYAAGWRDGFDICSGKKYD